MDGRVKFEKLVASCTGGYTRGREGNTELGTMWYLREGKWEGGRDFD